MKTNKTKKLDFIDVFSQNNISIFTKHKVLDINGNESSKKLNDSKILSDEKTYLSIGWI